MPKKKTNQVAEGQEFNENQDEVKAKVNKDTEEFELLYGAYDKEGNLHKEVTIKEMTGEDEENIAKADIRSNTGKMVTTLIAGCCTKIGGLEKGKLPYEEWERIVRNLFLGDRDYLLLKIRELNEGTEISFNSQCNSCKAEMVVTADFDELPIINPPDDPFNIEFTLPKGYIDKNNNLHTEGVLRLPNGFDQEQLDSVARKNMGQANTLLLTRCVKKLGDVKLSSKVFKELRTKDREVLVRLMADKAFGPRFTVETVCDNCGNEFEAGVNPVNFI